MVVRLQEMTDRASRRAIVLICAAYLSGSAIAAERPPLAPDQPSALTTTSRISATIELGLPSIASAIERDVPKRLANIDERIGCVNRRVFVFRIRANCDVYGFVGRGAMAFYGSGDHVIGSAPVRTPTPLPSLGNDVSQPGAFEILLPVRVGYDALRDELMQIVAASNAAPMIKEMQIYPSSGKMVIGVRTANSGESGAADGGWVYLSATLNVDSDHQSIKIGNVAGDVSLPDGSQSAQLQNQLLAQLKEIPDIGYGVAYQNLLNAANERLNRPLKNGFRMEGRLSSAKLDSIQLLADDLSIALRVSGSLRILNGM